MGKETMCKNYFEKKTFSDSVVECMIEQGGGHVALSHLSAENALCYECDNDFLEIRNVSVSAFTW